MNSRLDNFEEMLSEIQMQYKDTCTKLESLKAEGKSNTVAFKQLFASKLTLQNILIIYKNHGLIDTY